MGIDLAGVGLVVAFGFPSNIEEYFQMIGRAGRGGETSRTLLLWSGSDPIKREYQLKQTFLKVSELNSYLASLIGFFPTEMSQRFVTGAEIQRTLKLSPSEFDKKFGLLASALRVLGASTRCRKNQGELLYIEWKKGTNLTNVLENLPNEPTKRQIVLSSLSRLSDAGWSKQNGATGVFYTSDVILETALSLPVILQVLQFYANEGVLGYTQVETQESLQGIILTTTYKKAVASVSRYANIKSQGVESLDQLQALATAKTCRLEKAHVFFGGKENSNLRQKVQKCMQCDLCFQTQFHQKSTIPFAGFQTSRNLETAVQL
jgi:superfamily II DNA/RNA helicase